MARPSARYRIHAVAQATGLSTASLRAWERRYGIPSPARGDSGYRLYTERDISQVRRMVELGEQGIAPSEAARIVLAEAQRADMTAEVASREPDSDAFDAMVARLIGHAEALDQEQLERDLYSAMGMGSAWTVYEKVLSPVLIAIGDGWADGRISVGQEHLASQVLGTALRSLVRLLRRSDADRVALLACVDEEQHDLPLYGVAVLAASFGWAPRVLGPRTPPIALKSAVERLNPRLVGLSVTMPLVPEDHAALFADYGRVCGDVPWIVGGASVSEYTDHIEKAGGRVFRGSPAELRSVFETY